MKHAPILFHWRGAAVCLLAAAACLLVPPAPRASDGKIPIYEPTTITSPGSYYLTRDLTGSSSVASVITIATPAVTLDLAGHYIAVAPSTVGITVQGVGGVHIKDGMILDGETGIAATSWGAVRLERLAFANQTANAVTFGSAAPGAFAQPIIENCAFNACHSPISLTSCKGGRIERNEFSGSIGRAIELSTCTGNSVLSNTITGSTAGWCIYIAQGGYNLIGRNLMSNFGGASGGGGLYCAASYNTITDNTASGGGVGCSGFALTNSFFNRIRGNTAVSVDMGFHTDAASGGNFFQENTTTLCFSDGFRILGLGSVLEGNAARGNLGYGFNINNGEASGSHLLRDNTALGNSSGNWNLACGAGANNCIEYGAGYPTNVLWP